MTHELEIAIKEFQQELWAIDGVLDVTASYPQPFVVRFSILISRESDELRLTVATAISEFHRVHVQALSVELELLETVNAYATA